jgi:hypothetical protein
MGSGNGAAGS